MTTIKQFVRNLSHDNRHSIILDWKNYEETGSTGDTVLRIKAEELNKEVYRSTVQLWLAMKELYGAICEYYAYEAFKLQY